MAKAGNGGVFKPPSFDDRKAELTEIDDVKIESTAELGDTACILRACLERLC